MKHDDHKLLMIISVVAVVIIVLIVLLLPVVIRNYTGQAASRCKGDCQAPVAGRAYSPSLEVGETCTNNEDCTSHRCDPVDDAGQVYQCVPEDDDARVPEW